MASCRSSSKNTRKMNSKTILNKNSPRPHRELKFDMLGFLGKLVKYVVQLSKHIYVQNAIDHFLVSRNFKG
jgi:hypothetical protein